MGEGRQSPDDPFSREETLRVADQKQKLCFALPFAPVTGRPEHLGILTTVLLQNVARRLPESQVPKNVVGSCTGWAEDGSGEMGQGLDGFLGLLRWQ